MKRGNVTDMTNSVNYDPSEFGLSSRTRLKHAGENRIAILMIRKSRIIMKDGKKILENAEKIRSKRPELSVSVETTAPVCSKTIQFLSENGISVITIEG